MKMNKTKKGNYFLPSFSRRNSGNHWEQKHTLQAQLKGGGITARAARAYCEMHDIEIDDIMRR
jgi:hypothetical protein